MARILAGLLLIASALPASAETIRIHVRERLGGAPIEGAIVNVLEDAPLVRTVVTGAGGDARIEVPSTAKLSFTIRSPRHGIRCFTAADTVGGVLTADLDRSTRVHGTVTDSDGRPVPDAFVGLSYELDPACRVHIRPQPTMTGKDGRYVLGNVDLGRPFALTVDGRGHQRAVVERAEVQAAVDVARPEHAGGARRPEVNVTLRKK